MLFQVLSLLSTATALSILQDHPPQHIVANPPLQDEVYRIPTIYESTIMARRILHLTPIADLVSNFPIPSSSDDASTLENRPAEVQGSPIGLMEYIADCEPDTGNPTLLAINIATPFKNYHAGSNVSLSVRWWPARSMHYSTSRSPGKSGEEIPTPHTPAALPRFSLHGYLEPIPTKDLVQNIVPACFLETHPDSVYWQPGNEVSHESEYMRFVVEHVYWFGGFGDRARIGWLPIEGWRGVSREEIEGCRLPGEEEEDRRVAWR